MPSGLQVDGRYYCKPCKCAFAEWDTYFEHVKVMRAKRDPRHICCIHCGQRFKTERAQGKHVLECHPQPQQLKCAGCGDGPFASASALLRHIEGKKCPRVTSAMLNQKAEERTKFTRDLEAMTHRRVRGNFADYINPGKPGYYKGDIWETNDNGSAPAALDARGVWEVEQIARDGTLLVDHQMQPFSGLTELDEIARQSAKRVESSAGSNVKDVTPSDLWEDTTNSVAGGHAKNNASGSLKDTASNLADFLRRRDVASEGSNTGSALRAKDNVMAWTVDDAATSQAGTEAPTLLGGSGVKDWLFESKKPDSAKGQSTETLPSRRIATWIDSVAIKRGANAATSTPTSMKEENWLVKQDVSSDLPGYLRAASNQSDSTSELISLAGTSTPRLPGSLGVADWSLAASDKAASTSGALIDLPSHETAKTDETKGVWSLDPNVVSTRWPTAEEMASIPEQDLNPTYDSKHPLHPDNPAFKIERCRNLYNGYTCPMPFCYKVFNGANGGRALIGHLRGSSHGSEKITCPRCHKLFKTRASALAHAEAINSRCSTRHSKDYDAYVDQLTSGLVNVNLDRNMDGTKIYITPESAWDEYGGPKGVVQASKQPAHQKVEFW
ncbi:Protein S-acyltransferase [Purpureocillium takamizusanense]|uniref:Protein S-acyltransferase n=1 Tax=Purpureocillium takamizusanense TaxID=2060973 RepID=A0A9Q8QF38_9HYPO|nr:Protein S-acyltransferase [Purpureocillium takamizusanense]UNI19659.1 Protein S-acyltransferase [Purpureocillium takamizusanense]